MRLRVQNLLAILLATAACSFGCTIAKISAAGPRPLLLNNASGKFDVIKHFVIEKQSTFDYTNSAEMDQLTADVLTETKADAIVNMRIVIKQLPMDFVCNMVTCGIANAKTWSIEGDAIKFK